MHCKLRWYSLKGLLQPPLVEEIQEIQLKLDEETFKTRKMQVTGSLEGYHYIFFVC